MLPVAEGPSEQVHAVHHSQTMSAHDRAQSSTDVLPAWMLQQGQGTGSEL